MGIKVGQKYIYNHFNGLEDDPFNGQVVTVVEVLDEPAAHLLFGSVMYRFHGEGTNGATAGLAKAEELTPV